MEPPEPTGQTWVENGRGCWCIRVNGAMVHSCECRICPTVVSILILELETGISYCRLSATGDLTPNATRASSQTSVAFPL